MSQYKTEVLAELPQMKKEIIAYLFNEVCKLPRNDDAYYKYHGDFEYEGEVYHLSCECKRDAEMFTYRNLAIEHKQKEIIIDDEFCRQMLN